MGNRGLPITLLLTALLTAAGCGSSGTASGASDPGATVSSYLDALADDNGGRACDLLTVQARAEAVSTASTADCPAAVDELHRLLGSDADRLKDATTRVDSESGGTANVTASLEGHDVAVQLVKAGDRWRIDTARVALGLLGLG